MADQISDDEARGLFESLNPYQVAVLAFTSPAEVPRYDEPRYLTLTSKDSYVWAGAVAYIVAHRPEVTEEEMLGYLRTALEQSAHTYASRLMKHDLGSFEYLTSGFDLVRSFLRAAGFGDVFNEVCALTDDAIHSLEWLGVIEDPIRKKIAGILLSVYAFAGPVNLTGKGLNDFTYSTMTWQASAKKEAEETRFTFNLKVHKVVQIVKEEVIPGIGKVIDAVSEDEARNESDKIGAEELQTRLRELGYYDGPIDGKPWQKTFVALKTFQQDRSLRVTGNPDPQTVRALRESKRW